MNNVTTTSLDFDKYVSFIDKQLKDNALLIEEADVVFVCGKSHTGLTAISLKVGEMKCVNKTKLNNEQTTLIVVNNEYRTFDLIDLMKKIGVSVERNILHVFSLMNHADISGMLKNTQSVGVIDNIANTTCDDILIEMAKNQTSGLVLTNRFFTFNKSPQQDLLHRLKMTTRSFGLKLLFIETVKDSETGLINLNFSDVER